MSIRAATIAIGGLFLAATAVLADDQKPGNQNPQGLTSSGTKGDREQPSRQTEGKGQAQPQGRTGPTDTTTGGAPAASPQGETPAGMQADPHASDPDAR
ncbi:MAG TPA: hypothetical protein VHA77_10150 [Xanthobacteraceae bacterium]|jgi:hypothetical protein|nr:hypothetical protein [Xanthobacteraceae bacterium]